MLFVYKPRSSTTQKRTDHLIAALEEPQNIGNVNIFLLNHDRLRKSGSAGIDPRSLEKKEKLDESLYGSRFY